MEYVDYNNYVNNYNRGLTPKIDSASSFKFLEKKAERYLNLKTYGTYLNIDNEENISKIKDCLCALVDSYNDEENVKQDGLFKQSESVGGHSVTYASSSSIKSQYESDRIDISKMYLWQLGIVQSRKVFSIHEG